MEFLTDQQQNQLDSISDNLYQMYSSKPSHIKDEEALPMYSYDNPSSHFWRGFISGLLKQGATKEEVVWILQSKNMRWMFDSTSDKLEKFAESMANSDYINSARAYMHKE